MLGNPTGRWVFSLAVEVIGPKLEVVLRGRCFGGRDDSHSRAPTLVERSTGT